jgi:uncharacterized membrane protein YfcA
VNGPGPARAALLVALGIVIGAWGSLCGIGGGIFAVPVFHYLLRMPLTQAVANSLVLVAVMTTGGTLAELAQPGNALRWDVVGVLVATSWIGTQLGYRVAKRAHVRTLKLVFCLLLVGVAAQILLSADEHGASAGPAFAWDALHLGFVGATGLAAGFLAPLLGIGGGLVAVPALLLGPTALGYLGARACSTAMSACNGWQSVWLYREQGGVQLATASWASAGALAGAWIGVRVAHLPGVTFYAQLVIALTLLLIAGRFAWDLRARVTAST